METANSFQERLEGWHNEVVVIDCVSPFVAVGTLIECGRDYLQLRDADMHDLRDSSTTRENYLVKTAKLGVQPNRGTLLFRLDEIVAVSRLTDVIGG